MLTHKPDFIVVGAPKCGTTSLYYYLRQHPEIYLPERKELHYFSAGYLKGRIGGPGDKAAVRKVCDSQRDYENYFKPAPDDSVRGEISPSYFVYPETSEAIRNACGEIKIVIMLRDPVDKAFSQYCHLLKEGREELSFEESLQEELERAENNWNDFWLLTRSSFYCKRIQKFIDMFGPEQVLVILLEDFSAAPSKSLAELCRFIGVNDSFTFDIGTRFNKSGAPRISLFSRILTAQNRLRRLIGRFLPERFKQDLYNRLMDMNTGDKPELKPKIRKRLQRKFSNDIRCVEDIIGRETGWLLEHDNESK